MKAENYCKGCGTLMETRHIENSEFLKDGRPAILIRIRCPSYRRFRDYFLGRHSSYGDTFNLYVYLC